MGKIPTPAQPNNSNSGIQVNKLDINDDIDNMLAENGGVLKSISEEHSAHSSQIPSSKSAVNIPSPVFQGVTADLSFDDLSNAKVVRYKSFLGEREMYSTMSKR